MKRLGYLARYRLPRVAEEGLDVSGKVGVVLEQELPEPAPLGGERGHRELRGRHVVAGPCRRSITPLQDEPSAPSASEPASRRWRA
jgi:hypothetical protein